MNKEFIFCLKVENKHTGFIDMYFRDKLTDVVSLKNNIQVQFPKRLYHIYKVRNVPILDLLYLDSNEIRGF